MSLSNDLIGGSISQGYWYETTQRVFMGEYNDSPLGPGTGTRKYENMSVLNWVEASGSSGGGTSGSSLSNRGGGNSGSGKSSRRLNNDRSLKRKSQDIKNKNTFYSTVESQDILMEYFQALIEFGETGNQGLFEVASITDLTPNDPTNDRYIELLNSLINNGLEPVALSGNQKYNFAKDKNKNKIPNVHTPKNSLYRMRTAFYDASESTDYPAFDFIETIGNLGQVIAHEFFGHLLNALFGNINTEVSAMREENIYNWLYDFTQRYSYGYRNERPKILAPIIK